MGEHERSAEELPKRVAGELTSVRGRGLNEIDLQKGSPGARGRQTRLELPELERLARAAGFNRGSRPVDLRLLLQSSLDDFAKDAPKDAALIRQLFFDRNGEPPSAGATALLKAARGGLSESAFRAQQRLLFERFGGFLLTWAEPQPQPSTTERAGPTWLSVAVVAVVVVFGGASVLWLLFRGEAPSQPAVAREKVEPGGAVSVTVTFDSLGGTSSKVIDVFDDPVGPVEEAVKTGTYISGQTASATCLVTGRRVRSDTAAGERARETDQWVRIDAAPGVSSYATLTYATIAPSDLAMLPRCDL